jgi:NADH:ubiquinone oxidoreductase subunit 3 (subunit A)
MISYTYFSIFCFIFVSLFLSIFIYSLSYFLIKQYDDVEKLTAYECGFNPYNDARKVFDVRFYLIAILFLVFDLEAAFIFPWVITLDCNFYLGFWVMFEFLIELIVGYIYVWGIGALIWH